MRIRAVSLCVLPQPDNADRGESPGFFYVRDPDHTHTTLVLGINKPLTNYKHHVGTVVVRYSIACRLYIYGVSVGGLHS